MSISACFPCRDLHIRQLTYDQRNVPPIRGIRHTRLAEAMERVNLETCNPLRRRTHISSSSHHRFGTLYGLGLIRSKLEKVENQNAS